jgi:hypothetical protein
MDDILTVENLKTDVEDFVEEKDRSQFHLPNI